MNISSSDNKAANSSNTGSESPHSMGRNMKSPHAVVLKKEILSSHSMLHKSFKRSLVNSGDDGDRLKRPRTVKKQFDGLQDLRFQSHSPPSVDGGFHPTTATGHRPVTSCTHCRQHKIKCNASENFPNPCSRCHRMGLVCEIDPQFRPKKGSQLQNLRRDVDDLKQKIDSLTKNEQLILNVLKQNLETKNSDSNSPVNKVSVQTVLANEKLLVNGTSQNMASPALSSPLSFTKDSGAINDSVPANKSNSTSRNTSPFSTTALSATTPHSVPTENVNNSISTNKDSTPVVAMTSTISLLPSLHASVDQFVIGDVKLSLDKANKLHDNFVSKYLPYFPILSSKSATELYSQSQLLFWTVMLTSCLSDPEPTMYNKLAVLIKQLAIETCWIRTPRSTHISQALLILCNWPLPNQKILDDCSYRFVGLAKSLSFQLGLHRGEFISEFTRTQTSMPDPEKWRTRTWLGIFFSELCWASILGLPPTSKPDYLTETALSSQTTSDMPDRFRKLISLANFQAKLCEVMGSNLVTPDGLMQPSDRGTALAKFGNNLKELDKKVDFQSDDVIHVYYLYVTLMVCCFAFLPETPQKVQSSYIMQAYLSATKIITLLSKLLKSRQLIELPIYIRYSVTYAAQILFKLQLGNLLSDKCVDSARQSIVTVHRLYRNQLTAWSTEVENDISRTASVLEKLNFALITHPEVFVEGNGIITRIRSHLTGSLFYDLVWCIHEARRREMDADYNKKAQERGETKDKQRDPLRNRHIYPLPFYNQISKEDFRTITQTTPGGTTFTTLVPTKNALKLAQEKAKDNRSNGEVIEINGIPLSMLDETGSVSFGSLFGTGSALLDNSNNAQKNDTQVRKRNSQPDISSDIIVPKTSNYLPNSEMLLGTMNMQRSNSTPTGTQLQRPKAYSSSPETSTLSSRFAASNGRRATESLFTSRSSMSKQLVDEGLAQKNNTLGANSLSLPNSNTGVDSSKSGGATLPLSSSSTSNEGFPNLNMFLDNLSTPNAITQGINVYGNNNPNRAAAVAAGPGKINANNNNKLQVGSLSDLDSFFLQQSAGWIEGNSSNDDFLGWFDMNMEPKF